MGYTTDFAGEVIIVPPLNGDEIAYLNDFATTRRMDRTGGPYFVKGEGDFGQGNGPDQVNNHNGPPTGQPGLWCQWRPGDDGNVIEWDGGEKFYNSVEWMEYLIDHFLKPGAVASTVEDIDEQDARIRNFTFDHVLNGEIYAQGEDYDDRWKLVVENNVVKTAQAVITYPDPT